MNSFFFVKFGFEVLDNCVFVGNFDSVQALLIVFVNVALIISQNVILGQFVNYLKQNFLKLYNYVKIGLLA